MLTMPARRPDCRVNAYGRSGDEKGYAPRDESRARRRRRGAGRPRPRRHAQEERLRDPHVRRRRLHAERQYGRRGGLLLRVGKDRYGWALQQPHAREMEMRGKPVEGYVRIDIVDLDDEALNAWLKEAVTFVGTLPKKAKT
jgi:hypothetical protein